MGNRTAQMRTVDGQRAVDDAVDARIAHTAAVQNQVYPDAGDAEADRFADAVTGALQQVEVPTTFASMIVDMGKSLVQLQEERDKLDANLLAELQRIDEEAASRRSAVWLDHRAAATELGVRLQGVAKAMGA